MLYLISSHNANIMETICILHTTSHRLTTFMCISIKTLVALHTTFWFSIANETFHHDLCFLRFLIRNGPFFRPILAGSPHTRAHIERWNPSEQQSFPAAKVREGGKSKWFLQPRTSRKNFLVKGFQCDSHLPRLGRVFSACGRWMWASF